MTGKQGTYPPITTIDNTANIATLLETAYFSSATSFLAIVAANNMASLVDKLPDSRVHSGFLWFVPQLLMDPVTSNLTANGLTSNLQG